jgi:beta-galactosidase
MKKLLLFAAAVVVFLQADGQLRSKASFNDGWKFKLDTLNEYSTPAFDDVSWRNLNLPHDWSIEGAFDEKNPATAGGGALPGGIGWYRKTFTMPFNDGRKKISVLFDGVYRNAEVWINGQYLGKRPYGFSSFSYDLSPYLKFGEGLKNVIVVKVDNSKQPNSRWYSGSGIYRNVWLVKTNSIHVAANGTFISTPVVNNKQASIKIETQLTNESGKAEPLQVVTSITNKDGAVIAKLTANIQSNVAGVSTIQQGINLSKPKLWSVEDPYQYKANIKVLLNGIVVDETVTPFGIRYFRMDPVKGFSLNGKPLKILGVCNHHDLGSLGAAINTRALERQLEILKAMGCNGIRTSHNPPAPELLDLCDKMGFIVMDEAFDMWKKGKNPFDYHLDWDEWHEKDLRDMVIRDRNHPSIFFWSVGNEIPEQWTDEAKGDSSGRKIAKELVDIVYSLDTSRPVVTANDQVQNTNKLVQSGAFNVIGFNYHHQNWESFPKDYPGKSLIITESVSALETRGHYDLVPVDTIRRWPLRWDIPFTTGNKDYTVSAYDNVSTPWGSTHEETWRVFKNNDFVSGMFIWTGFDYLGEPTPYTWPARSSYFGIVDLAGFPKDVYYMYQAEATSKPVLHLLPHWNWNKGDTVDVVAYYNNADAVELSVNGKSFGGKTKANDVYHVSWRVPYEAGTITAVSKKNGKTVLTQKVQTAGKPAAIVLSADRSKIKADGKDLSFVKVTVVDSKGIVVPHAVDLITFKTSGNGFLTGVDNGDPTSHTSFKASERKAFNGLCLAILQSNGKKGSITLTATGVGLKAASIIVQAQ